MSPGARCRVSALSNDPLGTAARGVRAKPEDISRAEPHGRPSGLGTHQGTRSRDSRPGYGWDAAGGVPRQAAHGGAYLWGEAWSRVLPHAEFLALDGGQNASKRINSDVGGEIRGITACNTSMGHLIRKGARMGPPHAESRGPGAPISRVFGPGPAPGPTPVPRGPKSPVYGCPRPRVHVKCPLRP